MQRARASTLGSPTGARAGPAVGAAALRALDRQPRLGAVGFDNGWRWAPRSALLLGGGVSLVIWAVLLWGLFAIV